MSELTDQLSGIYDQLLPVMGDTVTVQHGAGTPYTISAIVQWPQQNETEAAGAWPKVTAKLSSFTSTPVAGMAVTIGSKTYKAFRVMQNEIGGVQVFLNG